MVVTETVRSEQLFLLKCNTMNILTFAKKKQQKNNKLVYLYYILRCCQNKILDTRTIHCGIATVWFITAQSSVDITQRWVWYSKINCCNMLFISYGWGKSLFIVVKATPVMIVMDTYQDGSQLQTEVWHDLWWCNLQ